MRYNDTMSGDFMESVKSAVKFPIKGLTYAVSTPIRGIVSAVAEPVGELIKTSGGAVKEAGKGLSGPMVALAVIAGAGLVVYLTAGSKLKKRFA